MDSPVLKLKDGKMPSKELLLREIAWYKILYEELAEKISTATRTIHEEGNDTDFGSLYEELTWLSIRKAMLELGLGIPVYKSPPHDPTRTSSGYYVKPDVLCMASQ